MFSLITRILMSLDIILWFIKMLHLYAFWLQLGPRVLMITKMAIQLIYFMIIFFLFIFAFGIATQALLTQNQIMDKFLLQRVFLPAFYLIVSNFFLADMVAKSKSKSILSDWVQIFYQTVHFH